MDFDTEKSTMDEEINSDSCSNSSNSADVNSEDEDVDESVLLELQNKVEANPYVYENHVALIKMLRKAAELERLREAREGMSKLFPLTPELWFDWLTDEQKLAVESSEKEKLIELFDRAVKDYPSVSVWLEYVQYMLCLSDNESGVQRIRDTFERALTAVGIHVPQGILIWETYREFELRLYAELQAKDVSENSEDLQKQKGRIYNLFRRQLCVPLLQMERTHKEFHERFSKEEIDKPIEQLYKDSCKKLRMREPYEDAIFQSEFPHLEEYKKYIEFEIKNGEPSRVQSVFERALLENCLHPDLWLEYTRYLDKTVNISHIVLPAYERAIRNCPWSVPLWKNYTLALERQQQPHDVIKEVFERSLVSGFTQGEEYREMWLGYLDYLRRRIHLNEDNDVAKDNMDKVFERAVEHIVTYFPNADIQCPILQYWAKVKAKYFKDISSAREMWNDIINHGHNGEAEMWMNFASLERQYGDEKHYRKLLLKGLHASNDWPETIGNALLTFEREEGTLETLDIAMEKYENEMKRIQERRSKQAEREQEKQQREAHRKRSFKHEKRTSKTSNQQSSSDDATATQKAKSNVHMDSEGFKIPPPRMQFVPEGKDIDNVSHPAPLPATKRHTNEELQQCDSKRPKIEKDAEHGRTVRHDPVNDERSVFLSNLAYTTGEDIIREKFSDVGTISEVRLVKDYKGRSKGYCYLVFSSKEEAQKALAKDREPIDDRPMFVSPCMDKKSSFSGPKFRYDVGLEKKKLFVRGLPFTTTKDDLEKIFKEYGTLKEVRLVTYRNGHSKGLAYIEYQDEAAASLALIKTDGTEIDKHVISVAISNPPERKAKKDPKSNITVSSLLGGGGNTTDYRPRGRGRTQLTLLPRALQKPSTAGRPPATSQMDVVQNGSASGSTNADGAQKLSNSDFRNMLLKR